MLHIWIEIKMGLVLKADKYLYFRKENDLMKDKEFDEYLDINSKKYIQDKYSMSLRELMTMYQNEEINLVPIYQRLFRWSGEQASKLIESIMLGIPLPPIFVSVRNGKWEVIDGVQRISSILWFYGNLVDENHKNPLVLSNLEILRELNGKTYNQLKKEYPNSLFKFFDIKRIDVNLLVSENIESEYTLFNRLNTGGISLSAQEIRNFLISKLNNKFYEEIKDFKDSKLCERVLTISDKQISEDYRSELLIYALIIINSDIDFEGKKGIEIFKNMARNNYLSRDRFTDLCITEVLKNDKAIKNIQSITSLFEIIHKQVPKKPFANGRKFSPFLYICVISFIHNHIGENINLPEVMDRIQNDERYKKKANRGTNVVDQFISGIEIGRNI